MWKGTYKRWEPLPEWSGCRVEIDAIHDDWEGFRIWIRSHDPTKGMLIARFEPALLYCSSDESDRIAGIQPTNQALKFPHVFWIVDDSELVAIFHRQSSGLHTNRDIIHFAFLSCNQCVDVIACGLPTFSGDELLA